MFPKSELLANKTVLRKVIKINNEGKNIQEWELTKLPDEPEEGMTLLEVGKWKHNNKPSAVLWKYNQGNWYSMMRPLTMLTSLAKLTVNLIDDTKRKTEIMVNNISLSKKKTLAKKWGAKHGYHINVNKVINSAGKEICMGWGELFDLKKNEILSNNQKI